MKQNKKIIFATVVYLILIALSTIFIVLFGFAIKNGRDYKNLGTKISDFEERQRRLNIVQRQQIVPSRENSTHDQNDFINNDLFYVF